MLPSRQRPALAPKERRMRNFMRYTKINKFHVFHIHGRIKSMRVLGFRGCRAKENNERKEEVCETTYVSKRADTEQYHFKQ